MSHEWDAVADTYETTSEKTTGAFLPRYLDFVRPVAGQLLADVGCGPGVLTLAFTAAGARVKALDASAPMIERLRSRAVDAGVAHLVEAFVGDAAALPFDASECDAAVSNFGVIFCADIDGALRELARVTRADGALMVSAWSREAENGWTSLLGPDHADVLGFRLPPRPMYHWSSSDEFAWACGRAGWVDVAVDEADGVPSTFDSADHIGDALEVPASKAVLRSLSESQHATLRAYLEHRARELFGDGEVRLPRHAWLATGRASL